MKPVLLLSAVLIFALPGFADSITVNGAPAGGPRIFDFTGGSLSPNWTGTALSGTLSNLVFNSSTGLLSATFNNNSRYLSGGFTRQLNIVSRGTLFGYHHSYGDMGSGNVKMTVQEPETFGLLGIGLVFVGGAARRKLKVR
ncbi:MAG: hypothetical protein WCA13_17695 [Terriglobales bacterium]